MEKFLDIIDEFNDNQKEFLALRVLGFDWKLIVSLMNMSRPAVQFWRGSERFREIENYVIEHKDELLSEVQLYFGNKLLAIDYALLNLAHRVVDWDKVEKIDKPYVMIAVKLVKERFGKEGKAKKEGWLLED